MPYFSVLIEGSGIDVPIADPDTAAAGFFASRVVFAENAAQAGRRAVEVIAADWEPQTDHGRVNRGARPTLVVDSTRALSWWRGFLRRNRRGYTFFPADEDGSGNADAPAEACSPVATHGAEQGAGCTHATIASTQPHVERPGRR